MCIVVLAGFHAGSTVFRMKSEIKLQMTYREYKCVNILIVVGIHFCNGKTSFLVCNTVPAADVSPYAGSTWPHKVGIHQPKFLLD